MYTRGSGVQSAMADHTHRFSDRVDAYVRARPGYPPALLGLFHLSPGEAVADVGSGTGLLTERFVAAGHPTFAVEPNGPMRAAAESRLGGDPNFHSVDGTAEATGLPEASVSLVTAGQAFHWFDAGRARGEFGRILRPGGVVALVWNERRGSAGDFTGGYGDLVRRFNADRSAVGSMTPGADVLAGFFGHRGYRTATFDNPQRLDRNGVLARLASSSYFPLPPDPRHDVVMAEAGQLFDRFQHGGAVTVEHDVAVYYGPPTRA